MRGGAQREGGVKVLSSLQGKIRGDSELCIP